MQRRPLLLLVAAVALVLAGVVLGRRLGPRQPPPTPRPPVRMLRPPPRPEPPREPSLEAAPSPEPPRMFRMDPQHTGRSGYRLPAALSILASFATGARVSAQLAVNREGFVLAGSHDGVLYALDPDTLHARWRLATGDRIYGAPAVALSGTSYVGSDSDRLVAVTSRGGLELALATDDDADTAPTFAPDGSLRFAAGRVLYATEPDLTVRWRLQFGGKVFSSPAVLSDGTTVVGCQDDHVYAVSPEGVVRWQFETNGDVDATPAIDAEGTVYIGSDDGSLYALEGRTGTRRWAHALGGFVRAGAALGLDGSVVVGTYGPAPRLVSLARDTGNERWSVPLNGPPTADYGVASAVLVDRDGRYAVGTPDDRVLLLERDGSVRASLTLPADVDTPPVLIADGVLLVGCDDGRVYRLGEPLGD